MKNTENVQAAERKEDQSAAVMSYASLNDGTTNRMYENVPEDGLYDSPYSISGSAYGFVKKIQTHFYTIKSIKNI